MPRAIGTCVGDDFVVENDHRTAGSADNFRGMFRELFFVGRLLTPELIPIPFFYTLGRLLDRFLKAAIRAVKRLNSRIEIEFRPTLFAGIFSLR